MRESSAGRKKPAPPKRRQISLCTNCSVCTCLWIRLGIPVPGWTAEPSILYKTGYQVHRCPQFVPMRENRRRT